MWNSIAQDLANGDVFNHRQGFPERERCLTLTTQGTERKDGRMAYAWEGFGKSPLTLVREELSRRFVWSREVDETYINYTILADADDEQEDMTAGVLYKNNSLFFIVDLMIECPDDLEILAGVASSAYELYSREEPFYGRLLIRDGRTYYQLNHILGKAGILDAAMASFLLDLVLKEVMEVISEGNGSG